MHQFPVKIKGEFIELRKITADDAYEIYRWRTSRSGRYMRQPDGYSVDSQRQWIASRGDKEANYMIFSLIDSVKVGTIGIYDINNNDKIANVGRLLLDEQYLTKSTPYGLESLKLMYGYVFEKMNFDKITGDILAINVDMYRLQIFLGMQQEGYLQSHVFINGKYYDLHIMSLLKQHFPKYCMKIDFLLKGFKK